jgi:CHAT domain-containing protein
MAIWCRVSLLTNSKGTNALRRAMLSLIKNPKYKDPYFWAGFVVVGAG